MKLVFCNSGKIGSWLIRKMTFSKWSHVAILLDNNDVIEAVWPKVRRSDLTVLLAKHNDYEIIDVPLDFESVAISYASQQVGKKYDWRALFGIVSANRDWSRDDEWFCSELAVRVLNIGLMKPLYKDITRVTPQILYLAVK